MSGAAELPEADAGNPKKARQRLNHWMTRPMEDRVRRSPEIARWANRIAAENPDNPDVQQMKRDLPAFFKAETLGALDRRQPFVAMAFYRAYRMLDFAPADPELAQRMNALRR